MKNGEDDNTLQYNIFKPEEQLLVYDDVLIKAFDCRTNDEVFRFWFHTSFIDSNGVLIINKDMIEGPHNNKKNFDRNF